MNEGATDRCAQDVRGAQGFGPARLRSLVAEQGWSPALRCWGAAGRLPADRFT